jgi:hypothetical protein
MKKLLIIILLLFLCTPVFAKTRLLAPSPDYKGTITGLRISAVDGTAFIDNANASVTALADGNHEITIYDSANRFIRGVLKAVGTSETLSEELLTGWTNNVTFPFEIFTSSGTDITSAVNSSNGGVCFSNNLSATSKNKLYKILTNITLNSGSGLSYYLLPGSSGAKTLPSFGSKILYYMSGADNSLLYYENTGTIDFSSTGNSVKQVTAPSSSGATIVTTKGGTTYNFNSKNASFTYNAASYYVIIRAIK